MILKDVYIESLNEIFLCYKEDYSPIINEFTHNIVYKENDEIVSFILYSSIYENIEIIDVFTKEEYRNKGYIKLLLNTLINENKDKNITLEVSEKNYLAISVYEKLGFKNKKRRNI
jgi:ribosomal protein S18 acetylase RimI-like enzyme